MRLPYGFLTPSFFSSCAAVPAAPQNLNIAGEYPNITIEWIRNDSIPITGYQLELQKSDYEEPPTYQITTSTSYQVNLAKSAYLGHSKAQCCDSIMVQHNILL